MGHQVTVFSGEPYPQLDDGVELVKVPGLDLYAEPHPFRLPAVWEYKTRYDLAEVAHVLDGHVPRADHLELAGPATVEGPRRRLRHRARQPVPRPRGVRDDRRRLAPCWRRCTIRSPRTATSTWRAATTRWQRMVQQRWYAFLGHADPGGAQAALHGHRVGVVAPATSSRDLDARPEHLRVVPVGVDTDDLPPRTQRRAGARSADGHGQRRRPAQGAGPTARGPGQGAHRACTTCTSW